MNEVGSYSCKCRRPGFVFSPEDGLCHRPDPCAEEAGDALCGDHGRCMSDEGAEEGFRCECDEGFRPDPARGGLCRDVNECAAEDNGGCEHFCENSKGSFRYYIGGCRNEIDLCTQGACIPPRCLCRSGFMVDPSDSFRCIDFDECKEHTNSCQQRCVNSVGSYRCDCHEG